MNPELAKIDLYYDEVRRRWPVNAELAVSRDFFLLWQQIQQPRPCALGDDETVEIQGIVLDLVKDTGRYAHTTWDTDEMTPALVIEGDTATQRVLLMIQDGEPVLDELPPVFSEDDDVTYGERLEVFFDIIDHYRRLGSGVDVRSLRGQAYADALKAIADHHPERVIQVMRRLRRDSRERLLTRALAEFAVDEVTQQLELPLGGTFAPGSGETVVPAPAPSAAPVPSEPSTSAFEIGQRTAWDIALDVELLAASARSHGDYQDQFILRLGQAEIVRTFSDGDLALRVPLREEDRVFQEGDRLQVIRHGNITSIGELRVDLMDRDQFYGRLRWTDRGLLYPIDNYLCAIIQRGPNDYLSKALEVLQELVTRHSDLLPGALRAALGFDATRLEMATGAIPAHLDASQARCFAAAVNEVNALVLIQGPPGTGKTRVLEHVVRELCERGRRILITAPSNTAVDTICRRLSGLPLLRTGYSRNAVASDVADASWYADEAVQTEVRRRAKASGSMVIAGTHTGILRSVIVRLDQDERGAFDAIIFDESGMARAGEMLLCMGLANRVICFGDPMQLPPLPLEDAVLRAVSSSVGERLPSQRRLITHSGLQWLTETRGFPMLMMTQSYRCQNPRLLRFASTLFYDARVKANDQAEYFALPFHERQQRFPASSLCLFSTSKLPAGLREEHFVIEGKQPGLENRLEASVVIDLVFKSLQHYPLDEVTVITPYRRQVRLLRNGLLALATRDYLGNDGPSPEEWAHFVRTRVSTVDSFQGGESDVVIISYVRSNDGRGIGFVTDPNRVNVTHTRARREMLVVADADCLVQQCESNVFRRMVRAFERDGEVVEVTQAMVRNLPPLPGGDRVVELLSGPKVPAEA